MPYPTPPAVAVAVEFVPPFAIGSVQVTLLVKLTAAPVIPPVSVDVPVTLKLPVSVTPGVLSPVVPSRMIAMCYS